MACRHNQAIPAADLVSKKTMPGIASGYRALQCSLLRGSGSNFIGAQSPKAKDLLSTPTEIGAATGLVVSLSISCSRNDSGDYSLSVLAAPNMMLEVEQLWWWLFQSCSVLAV